MKSRTNRRPAAGFQTSLVMIIGLVAASVLQFSETARATTYYIDAFAPGGLPGTGRYGNINYCYHGGCATGYQTPVYKLSPGDTVDFGTLTLYSPAFAFPWPYSGEGDYLFVYDYYDGNYLVRFDGSGEILPYFYLPFIEECNPSEDSLCGAEESFTVPLIFTIPSTGYIQVAWSDPFGYSPPILPTPLPPTISLLVAGLATLGLLGWRRKRRFQS